MSALRRWLLVALGMAGLAAALTQDAVAWAQGYGGVGFPSAAGRAMGQLAAAFCSITGCTMTGQIVFSGVTTDITTGTNENLSLAPNGTGQVDIQAPIQNSQGTTLDFREALTYGGTSTCNGVGGTEGEFCIIPTAGEGMMLSTATGNTYQRIWAKSNGSSFLQLIPNGTANPSYISFFQSGTVASGYIGAAGTADPDADFIDKNYWLSMSNEIVLAQYDNMAAGTVMFRIVNNAGAGTGAGTSALTVDGAGNIKLDSGATRTRGTITLAAGTGTATVASGSICVCTDTTANASVQCAVAATTLTATGTGTDVIAYHCL